MAEVNTSGIKKYNGTGSAGRQVSSRAVTKFVHCLVAVIMGFLIVAGGAAEIRAQNGQSPGAQAQTAGNETAVPEKNEPGRGENSENNLENLSEPSDPYRKITLEEAYQRKVRLNNPEVSPRAMDSLFYTPWQYSLLQEARAGLKTSLPTEAEAEAEKKMPRRRDPGIRELSLGGILYHTPDDWTIWLNGQRVKPDAIPQSVIDIDVQNQYVELKWYDEYTNMIFPIRLRPHERFNLDSRIFLPGKGS